MRDRIVLSYEQLKYLNSKTNNTCNDEDIKRISLNNFDLVMSDIIREDRAVIKYDYDSETRKLFVETFGFNAETDILPKKLEDGNAGIEFLWDSSWNRETETDDDEKKKIIQETIAYFMIINMYMADYEKDIFDVEEKVVENQSKKKYKGKRKNKVRLYKCYTLKKNFESIPKKKKKAIITCEEWTVRGHLRHYKSGKTGWVKSYVKGKERENPGKLVGKEYKLMEG